MKIICEPDPQAARVLAAAIGGEVRIAPTPGVVSVLLVTATGRCPVVIGPTIGMEEALRFTAQVTAEHPAAAVILVREQATDAEMMRAKRAGVRAVFGATEHTKIARACSAVIRPRADGQVFSVFGAKGGCGKTTVAINLAVALQRNGNRRVCLLDLDLDCGDIAAVLNLDTSQTLALLAGQRDVGELLDTGDLITSLASTGLDCILAPVAPGDAERIRPAKIGRLLRALVSRYDAVVVDLPARFSPTTLVALDHAQHHIVVSLPERPALKNLRLTLTSWTCWATPALPGPCCSTAPTAMPPSSPERWQRWCADRSPGTCPPAARCRRRSTRACRCWRYSPITRSVWRSGSSPIVTRPPLPASHKPAAAHAHAKATAGPR